MASVKDMVYFSDLLEAIYANYVSVSQRKCNCAANSDSLILKVLDFT